MIPTLREVEEAGCVTRLGRWTDCGSEKPGGWHKTAEPLNSPASVLHTASLTGFACHTKVWLSLLDEDREHPNPGILTAQYATE